MVAGRIPHATRPNEGFEAQADLTRAGMYHFAVPGGPTCGTCQFYGFVSRQPSPKKRHKCRKAWSANGRKVRLPGDQAGCRYHTARPPKAEKTKRSRKAGVPS